MMQEMRLSELVSSIPSACLVGADTNFKRCTLDSRDVQSGDLFVALKGERFDAHDFLEDVVEQGAAALLVSQKNDMDVSQVVVPDTLLALGYLAKANRDKFNGRVIALTGSAGKTTSKEMIACVLREQGRVFATQGNFNNEVGVPRTLLALDASYDFAVVEMGAAKLNDIEYLMQFVNPQVGILLNALPAHIEGFKSLENVAKTKFEVISCLQEDATAVINLDDNFSQEWIAQAVGKKVIAYSYAEKNSLLLGADLAEHAQLQLLRAQDIKLSAWGSEFVLELSSVHDSAQEPKQNKSAVVRLAIPGEHNIANALAAAAAGLAVGLSLETIAAGLAKFSAVAGRMAKYKGCCNSIVIDDTYNANPHAMEKALDVLAASQADDRQGKRIFIMGDMAELGAETKSLHAKIGTYAQQKTQQFWAVGDLSLHACEAFGDSAKHFSSQQQLIDFAQKNIAPNDIILVKGSRSAAMDNVVNALRAQPKGDQ